MNPSSSDDSILHAYAPPKDAGGADDRVAQPLSPRAVLVRAMFSGAAAGLLLAVIAGVPYYLENHLRAHLEWGKVAVLFVIFTIGTGGVFATGSVFGMMRLRARRIFAARGRFLKMIGSIAGAVLGGAIAGLLPGSIGGAYFGDQHAPFMGMTAMAVAPFVTVIVLSALIADLDRRAQKNLESQRRSSFVTLIAFALAAFAPFIVLGLLGAATFDDDTVLAMFRRGAPTDGADDIERTLRLAGVGALYGCLLGAGLGFHMGLTTALSNRGAPHHA